MTRLMLSITVFNRKSCVNIYIPVLQKEADKLMETF